MLFPRKYKNPHAKIQLGKWGKIRLKNVFLWKNTLAEVTRAEPEVMISDQKMFYFWKLVAKTLINMIWKNQIDPMHTFSVITY